MSGRAVRKAVRKREAELELLKASTPNLNSDASESEEEAPAPQKQSLFALLNIPDERDEQDDEEEEEEEEEPAPPPKPVAASKKSKNKKKKSAKAKSKVQKEDQGEEEDDIDKALRQLKVSGPGVTAEVSEPTAGKDEGHLQLSSVLSIDTRSLDAGNEMKKLFGKDALRPEDGEGAGGRRRGAARVQLVPGGATGGRSLNKGRKNTFVQPKDDWPNSGSGGLGMEIEDTDLNGVTTYRFVHSRQYQGVQREFMMCVASMGKL